MDRVYMDKDGFHIEGSRMVLRKLKEAVDKALEDDTTAFVRQHKFPPVDVPHVLMPDSLPIHIKVTR